MAKTRNVVIRFFFGKNSYIPSPHCQSIGPFSFNLKAANFCYLFSFNLKAANFCYLFSFLNYTLWKLVRYSIAINF